MTFHNNSGELPLYPADSIILLYLEAVILSHRRGFGVGKLAGTDCVLLLVLDQEFCVLLSFISDICCNLVLIMSKWHFCKMSRFGSLSECHSLFRLGFTTQQSEVIVSALVKIMNTNLDMIYKDMVTKVQQVRSEAVVGLK